MLYIHIFDLSTNFVIIRDTNCHFFCSIALLNWSPYRSHGSKIIHAVSCRWTVAQGHASGIPGKRHTFSIQSRGIAVYAIEKLTHFVCRNNVEGGI